MKAATRKLLEALERNGPHGKLAAVDEALAAGADPCAASENPARRGAPALALACTPAYAAPGVVERLLAAGALVDATDGDGRTALHHAAFGDRDVELESARLLIAHGASLSAVDRGGAGPLHATAFNDNGRMAALLLEAGADPTVRDLAGETALEAAVQRRAKAVLAVLRGTRRSSPRRVRRK